MHESAERMGMCSEQRSQPHVECCECSDARIVGLAPLPLVLAKGVTPAREHEEEHQAEREDVARGRGALVTHHLGRLPVWTEIDGIRIRALNAASARVSNNSEFTEFERT